MFTDSIEIQVQAGKGGDGRMSFRHEKYRAKGGPDGGDGGHGGTVSLLADHNINTLSAFRTNRTIKAQDGEAGGGDRKHDERLFSTHGSLPSVLPMPSSVNRGAVSAAAAALPVHHNPNTKIIVAFDRFFISGARDNLALAFLNRPEAMAMYCLPSTA